VGPYIPFGLKGDRIVFAGTLAAEPGSTADAVNGRASHILGDAW